jgi:nucleoid-associated protein YgaU
MPLLEPKDLNIASLMSDLPMQINSRNCLRLQLQTVVEGLRLYFNPLQRVSAVRFHSVAPGETLQIVSMRVFGTIDRWREIALENKMDEAQPIWPGLVLRLPSDIITAPLGQSFQ